jgi:hypothetical protein
LPPGLPASARRARLYSAASGVGTMSAEPFEKLAEERADELRLSGKATCE